MTKRTRKSVGKSPSTKPPKTQLTRVDVSAPAPAVIELLRRVSNWGSETPAERDHLLTSVRMVLGAWDTRGDLQELRALLGVKPRRKRKNPP